MQVADDRDARRGGRGRGVERREVVQVQDVGACGVDGAQRAGPGADLAPVGHVVERGEDRLGRVGPVLEVRLGRVDGVHVDPA